MFGLILLSFLVVCAVAIFLCGLYKIRKKERKIPGFEPSDLDLGNIPDLIKAGGFHEFMTEIHEALFKGMLEPLLGPKCLQFTNGQEGRRRRKLYDRCYGYKEIKALYSLFNELGQEWVNKWMKMANDQEHIPLNKYMMALALKTISLASFGDHFKDEETLNKFCNNYNICWAEIENTLLDNTVKPGSPEEKIYKSALNDLNSTISDVIEHRRNNPPSGDRLLIDVFLDTDYDDETIHSDALLYVVGGFHNTGNLMAWALYYLASHEDVQEKLYTELSELLDKGEDVSAAHTQDMPYLKQIVDETMRCSAIGTIAARYRDEDAVLDGYIIPKGTPVLQALSALSYDKKLYPEPRKFDPERFSKEQVKTRPPHAFEPFGFAGKRKCPGYRFAYAEAYVYLARFVRQFKIHLVDGQDVVPSYALISRPKDEIWITINERDA
ncbi:cytochrome P450 20A1-like isoform X3 [Tubulanus polymorphus]|uniref:cytochrome P450 20A1-like isoform X3 n=1 Tax=Tubulanus polymorphus TaxID=672921 RepID=UPI003DA44A40